MFLFPKWTNKITGFLLIGLIISLGFSIFVFWYWFSPDNLDVGYSPKQPIAYSHKLHVSELGIDCRYCHHNVETAAHANIPTTETCMSCHQIIRKGTSPSSEKNIAKLVEYYEKGEKINWVRVHFLPDYTYFNHSAHINAGVSCVSCHGRIDQMEVVHQSKPLSMGWCLECHRSPEKHLRPKELITQLDWKADDPITLGKKIKIANNVSPKEDCSTCHR